MSEFKITLAEFLYLRRSLLLNSALEIILSEFIMKINHLKLFYNEKINVNYAKRCVFDALHALAGRAQGCAV